MTLLIDTQAILYYVMGRDTLSGRAFTLMEDRANRLLFSIAGAWEIAIKVSIGRLDLGRPVGAFITFVTQTYEIELLPVSLSHVEQVATLPLHHRDPFDRMLVAQSMVEGIPLLSSDAALDRYAIDRIW